MLQPLPYGRGSLKDAIVSKNLRPQIVFTIAEESVTIIRYSRSPSS